MTDHPFNGVYMRAETGRHSGFRHVCVYIIFIAFRLYEAFVFEAEVFVPSRLGGILLSAAGIYRVSHKNPKTIENDLLLEFQCLALN